MPTDTRTYLTTTASRDVLHPETGRPAQGGTVLRVAMTESRGQRYPVAVYWDAHEARMGERRVGLADHGPWLLPDGRPLTLPDWAATVTDMVPARER